MRIDAHLHFWKPASGFDNKPIADHAAYRRDFLPADLAPTLDDCGIDGAILVQSAPQTAESDWCIELARDEPRMLGVTAWVDLDSPAVDYAALCARPKVVGIRAQLRRIADDGFVMRPRVIANLGAALASGLNVTILAEARHYARVIALLGRLPDGPVTLNHLGLPFPDVDRSAWRDVMRALAQRPQAFVQLSGLPFLFGDRWREADARSILEDAFALLGAERLMFASDWPMLVRFATYGEWVHYVESFLDAARLSDAERHSIFAGNVLRANPRLQATALRKTS